MRHLQGALVFFGGFVVHWLWSTYLPFFGLAPQVLLVMTVAIAARSGPIAGQCFAFAWGLLWDALGIHVFGAHALTLTLTAYAVGTVRRQIDVSSGSSQLVLLAVLTPAYILFYAMTGLVFEKSFLWGGWKVFILSPFYNCLVAPLVFEATRRWVDL
jgi:rod shape-determining protein MreD